MPWNSYTYSTLQYNWKVPRSKHISFFCTGWSTSRIIKDHRKSLRRTALSPSLQSIRSSCAVARNSAVALTKLAKKQHIGFWQWRFGSFCLYVFLWNELRQTHVCWKKRWYGWILRTLCSSPKPPTPYSHTVISIHFALSPPGQQNMPNPKKSFYSDSNQKQNGTSRYRTVEKADQASLRNLLLQSASNFGCHMLLVFLQVSLTGLGQLGQLSKQQIWSNFWSFTSSMVWK